MTQTRTFLLFAWLMVAALLWMEWNKEQAPQPAAAVPQATTQAAVPTVAGGIPAASVPGGAAASAASATAAVAAAPTLTLKNDVLALQLDGRSITGAQLLKYPQTRAAGSLPVVLFDADPARYFVARSHWTAAPAMNAEPSRA